MRKKQRKQKRKLLLMPVLALLCGGLLALYAGMMPETPAAPIADLSAETPWYLVLVNESHPLPDDDPPPLTTLDNGRRIDSRIAGAVQELFAAMEADGLHPMVREGYRTAEEQAQMMQDRIETYQQQGYSRKRAEKHAAEYVAAVGCSEHQLGLALDINDSGASSQAAYEWLAANAWQYGFILRYPMGKTPLTGIDYEPWHYRYVGKDAAKVIWSQGLCLEEYLQQTAEMP